MKYLTRKYFYISNKIGKKMRISFIESEIKFYCLLPLLLFKFYQKCKILIIHQDCCFIIYYLPKWFVAKNEVYFNLN